MPKKREGTDRQHVIMVQKKNIEILKKKKTLYIYKIKMRKREKKRKEKTKEQD